MTDYDVKAASTTCVRGESGSRQYRVTLEYRLPGETTLRHSETVHVDCAKFPSGQALKDELGRVARDTIASLNDSDAVAASVQGGAITPAAQGA